MDMYTFDEIKRVIHNIHVFDYIRNIVSNGNNMLPIEQLKSIGINLFMRFLLEEIK